MRKPIQFRSEETMSYNKTDEQEKDYHSDAMMAAKRAAYLSGDIYIPPSLRGKIEIYEKPDGSVAIKLKESHVNTGKNVTNEIPPAEGAEEMLPEFGDYCTIEMKRYGCANEHYTHKVIGTLKSNTWVDVPVQSPATESTHYVKELESVVACVCEGIAEREILRYRVSDIRNLKKSATLHAQRLAEKMVQAELNSFVDFINNEYCDGNVGNMLDTEDVINYLKSRESHNCTQCGRTFVDPNQSGICRRCKNDNDRLK